MAEGVVEVMNKEEIMIIMIEMIEMKKEDGEEVLEEEMEVRAEEDGSKEIIMMTMTTNMKEAAVTSLLKIETMIMFQLKKRFLKLKSLSHNRNKI